MAKFIEAGATTRFFHCYVRIDKGFDPFVPQQNDINVMPDIATDDLDQAADTDDMHQEATTNDEIFQQTIATITIANNKQSGKKPFQLKGRLSQHVSRFKRLKPNDSCHFSF